MAKKEFLKEEREEMTLEEAKAYRASLHRPQPKVLTLDEKKDLFRLYWAQERKSYGSARKLEHLLWTHLVATGNSDPEAFEAGISHFGLKKIK